jgi:ketosteroid isomerase-like protein
MPRLTVLAAAMAMFLNAGATMPATSVTGGPQASGTAATDSSDVAATVARFHAAMAVVDSAAALSLLADDVVILESGGAESREEFRSGHLAADIAFARAVSIRRDPAAVRLHGDVAWVSETSTSQGDYRGRQVNTRGAELMVLSREARGWKIRAIHWSSRALRPGG